MQIDMHYYGVYALALLAGLNKEAAETIAVASQYVDDSITDHTLDHESGAKLIPEETAHHAGSIRNLDRDHQRYIWIPFHFFPGNEGQHLTERLVCREDGKLAKEMVRHHLGLAKRPFALELMGVTAHVYADTFAHFGFSGVSSRRNKVRNEDIEIIKASKRTRNYWDKEKPKFFRKYGKRGGFWRNIKRSIFSAGAEVMSGALGHGAVLTFPDQPYLHWKYEYEDKFDDRPVQEVDRENQTHFLNGCRALFDMFAKFAKKRSDYCRTSSPVSFNPVEAAIKDILALEDGKKARSRKWCQLVKQNKRFGKITIPEYNVNKGWNKDRDDFPGLADVKMAKDFSVYHFYQAASLHRHYVLRELLPKYGIVVV